jgi:hypothetical protein
LTIGRQTVHHQEKVRIYTPNRLSYTQDNQGILIACTTSLQIEWRPAKFCIDFSKILRALIMIYPQ